jgi:hypothetical protein
MLAMQGLRAFSLSPNRDSTRISCGAHGAFVGDVALLRRMQCAGETGVWTARSVAELNSELTARYRLPIDVSSKAGALALIANAFNRSDLATAAISTVQMQFPDLPSLAKGPESTNEMIPRALELHRSHLLKVDLDWEAKHPRTGTPPNPGWFALVPTRPQAPNVVPAAMPHPLRPWDHRDLFGGEGGEGVGVVEAKEFRAVRRGLCLPANRHQNHRLLMDRHRNRHPQAKHNQRFHFQGDCP